MSLLLSRNFGYNRFVFLHKHNNLACSAVPRIQKGIGRGGFFGGRRVWCRLLTQSTMTESGTKRENEDAAVSQSSEEHSLKSRRTEESKDGKQGQAPSGPVRYKRRCHWVSSDPDLIKYHDEEWGNIVKDDDRKLFEILCLEGAQAGLSWATILRKRQRYRDAFHNFDIEACSKLTDQRLQEILTESNPEKTVVRNHLKVFGVRTNAIGALRIQSEFGSLSDYLWKFAPKSRRPTDVRVTVTKESTALSKDLKSRGFVFVGPTIMLAFMQAVGMVNFHSKFCFKFNTR